MFPRHNQIIVREKHIYLLKSGRISMCGVTPANIDYVAQSINQAVTQVKAPGVARSGQGMNEGMYY